MILSAHVHVRLPGFQLQADVDVAEGEVVALLGPSGAGKTTLLRALAGLVPLAAGRVELDGRALEDTATGTRLPAERRPVGVVFQDYLLFPHLSVLENVAFGLRCRGVPKGDARVRAGEWLDRLGLGGHAGARPRSLSGGQAQRVALARALATDPRLLLLDEPLSALDAATRVDVRRHLRRHLASFAGARLLVTHDPLEAMILADRLVVLEAGRVVQTGPPDDIRDRPRSPYVAELVGLNLFRGRGEGDRVRLGNDRVLVAPGSGEGDVFAVVHPRAVALHRTRPEGTARNVWEGPVESLDFEGDRVRVRVGGAIPVVAEVTPAAARELHLAEAGTAWVSVKATEVTVYPA